MFLESLLTQPSCFGLKTATPVQIAVCRALTGKPLGKLREDEDVIEAFGGTLPVDGVIPKEFVLLAGIRSAKTLIAACLAVYLARTCDMTGLGAGEVPRISILSTQIDQALACLKHLTGHIQASPLMQGWLIGEPTSDTVVIKHESGRPVEIKVVAGSRAGSTLVARWMAGVIFDEAPRIAGDEESVVNIKDSRRAVLGRMRPGCPIVYIGSPWAPYGVIYDWFTERHGHPTANMVVVRATGPQMNPFWWTEERCENLRVQDAQAYETDVLANFADVDEQFFATDTIDANTRAANDIAPDPRHHYVATMDPATRSNAWTFTITTCTGLGGKSELLPKYSVVLVRQWKAQRGDKLRPKVILGEIAESCRPYRIDEVHTDQYSADALSDLAEDVGLHLNVDTIGQVDKYENVKNVHTILNDGRLELPPDALLKKDLQLTKRKVTQNGVTVKFTRTADGRHCDFVPALGLALRYPPDPPEPEEESLDILAQRRERLAALDAVPYWEAIDQRFRGVA